MNVLPNLARVSDECGGGPTWGMGWGRPALHGRQDALCTPVYPGPAPALQAECLAPKLAPSQARRVTRNFFTTKRKQSNFLIL